MMAFAAAAAAAQAAAISYQDGVFTLQSGASKGEIVAFEHSAPSLYPAERITLNYGARIVQLDAAGITLRTPEKALGTSRLAGIPLNPRVATEAERSLTQQMVKEGKRELGLSSISGYQSFGSKLYLLARWGDVKAPWMEAMVMLDMSQESPAAQFVGRFPGFAYAASPVDDRVIEINGGLAALISGPEGYGLAQMNPESGEVRFQRLGAKAGQVRFLRDGLWAVALTETAYGAVRLTLHDFETGRATLAGEIRGAIKGITEPRYLRYARGTDLVVLNLETGAEKVVPADSAMASSPFGLLVWWPGAEPRQASLYEHLTYRPLGRWTAGG
jgi:hypothetical protein